MQAIRFGEIYGFTGTHQQSKDILQKLSSESSRLGASLEAHLLYRDIFSHYDSGIDTIAVDSNGNDVPGWDYNYGDPPATRQIHRAPRKVLTQERGPELTDYYYPQRESYHRRLDPSNIEQEAWVIMTRKDAYKHDDMKSQAQRLVAKNPIVQYFQRHFYEVVTQLGHKSRQDLAQIEKGLGPQPAGYPQEALEVFDLIDSLTPPHVDQYQQRELPFAPYAQYAGITAYYTADEILDMLDKQTLSTKLKV